MPAVLWMYWLEVITIVTGHRIIGLLCDKMHQPRVLGDIIAGCMLGPTLMGSYANSLLFPPDNRPLIEAAGNLGLILVSLSAGLSFDVRVLQGQFLKAVLLVGVDVASACGWAAMLSQVLPPRFHGSSAISFYFYFAAVLNATALPMAFLVSKSVSQ